MNSKKSKSERKEERIQTLERELAKEKKKSSSQSKTIRFEDEQYQQFMSDLTERIEWSTNRIADETKPIIITDKSQKTDGFSSVIKWTIGSIMICFTVLVFVGLFNTWNQYWCNSYAHKAALIMLAFAGFDSLLLGVEIIREKDRNYIIALFSALVSLIALIITLIK